MSPAKIRIKVGEFEIQYEGDPAFLTDGLDDLLTKVADIGDFAPADGDGNQLGDTPLVRDTATDGLTVSTNTIAAHLHPNSGPDLVICALANLELVQGKSGSNRKEILAEMKNATSYFSSSMRGNLTKSLSNLTKSKRINEIAKGSYALSANEKKAVGAKIAEIR